VFHFGRAIPRTAKPQQTTTTNKKHNRQRTKASESGAPLPRALLLSQRFLEIFCV
jgi:hypothetical protein